MKYQDFLKEMSVSTGFEPEIIDTVLSVMPDVLVSILNERDNLKTPLGCFKVKRKGPKPLSDYTIPQGFKVALYSGTHLRYLSEADKEGRTKRLRDLKNAIKTFEEKYPYF
jgi:hypothetical protein